MSDELEVMHGGRNVPPTRLCLCGHNYSVHSRGWCGVAAGCECKRFRDVSAPIDREEPSVD